MSLAKQLSPSTPSTRSFLHLPAASSAAPTPQDDASIQPGQANFGQLLLHETAVSWVKYRLARTLPAKAWEESVDQFGTRLRSIANDINAQMNVEGLCKEFPARVEAVLEQGGDNIAK